MTTEDIILQHSARGMDRLRPHLPADYCARAASSLLARPRGTVLLITGFYVNGAPETDGPPGTMVLAHTLHKLGFSPVIAADEPCRGLFEPLGFAAEYLPLAMTAADAGDILARYEPTAIVSVEHCGRNDLGEYASMRGINIGAHTAPADLLFDEAAGNILTVGIGDGGNEIGMGSLAPVIRRELSLRPCVVPADELVIATVSNWGAYGLAAQLRKQAGLGDVMPDADALRTFFAHIVSCGCTDGMSGQPEMKEDGFDLSVGLELYNELQKSR